MQSTNKDIQKIKIDFNKLRIDFSEIPENPFILFRKWFYDVLGLDEIQSISCILSTVNENIPSSRVVFLKGVDTSGFIFFTNYNSRKGSDIEKNPNVCLNFNWPALQRQVCILGVARKISKEKADNYFKTRSRKSQLGAWASSQSSKINFDTDYNSIIKDIEKQFRGKDIKRPKYWGGYIINPVEMEFWQGRPGRLHDRLKYQKIEGDWNKIRLAP